MTKFTRIALGSLCVGFLAVLVNCSPSAGPAPATSSPSSPKTSAATPTVKSPTPAPYSFAGKTISIVVPYGAGGGSDITGRALARFIGQFLPGNPSVLIRNMAGGNSTIGTNYVYSAKPDGLTVLLTGGSVTLNQLIGVGAVRYDLLKTPVVLGYASGVFVYSRTGIINSPVDLLKAKGLVFGSGPETAPTALLFVAAKELLDIPTDRVVLGYSGAGDTQRAFLSGEINASGIANSAYSDVIAPQIAKGEVMMLFQSGILDEKGNVIKDPGLPPDVLTIKELYEKANGRLPSGLVWDAVRAIVAGGVSYKVMVLPPGTPDNIVRTYWNASQAMIKDPGFRKVVDALVGKDTVWATGEEYDKGFKLNFAVTPETRKWLRDTLPRYGVAVD